MKAEVIVIGGGMVGSAIAYGLASQGTEVLVLDGDDRDPRASTANFGLVWLHGKGIDMPAYHMLSRDSVRQWADACEFAPCPYVEGWFVEEDLRRRGIGKALMAAIEAWCVANGYKELGSDSLLENEFSIEAHQRLGFVPIERLQLFRKALG